MSVDELLDQVESFSDLQLAVLLCLIADEHCIVEVEDDAVDDLAQELSAIAAGTFGLSHAIATCSKDMTLDSFGQSILDDTSLRANDDRLSHDGRSSDHGSQSRLGNVQFGHLTSSYRQDVGLDIRKVANVVIAKDFDLAPEAIQVQSLELMRRKRIYTRTTIHPAPETYLFIPLVSSSRKGSRLNKHLNDRIMMYHVHDIEDGFPNLELSSSSHAEGRKLRPMISATAAKGLKLLTESIKIMPDVRRFIANVPIYLRLQRALFLGISPNSTTHLIVLSKALAVVHHLDYVTPSLVQLAAQKVYTHRIEIPPTPRHERSFQYGSTIEAIKEALANSTPLEITNTALNSIEPP